VEGEQEEKSKDKDLARAAADLEKVTDFHEDKELQVSNDLGSLIDGPQGNTKTTNIAIRKEDVQLIMNELELPRVRVEKKLIQHGGNVVATMRDLLGLPLSST